MRLAPIAFCTLLAALALAPSASAEDVPLPPLALTNSIGQRFAEEAWPSERFTVLFFLDGTGRSEYDLPTRSRTAHRWLDRAGQDLALLEIIVVDPELRLEGVVENASYSTAYVHADANRAALGAWLRGGKSRAWLIAPDGFPLLDVALDDVETLATFLWRCLAVWRGVEPLTAWERVAECEDCWRHAARTCSTRVAARRSTLEWPPEADALLRTSPHAFEADAHTVRLALLLVIATHYGCELPAEKLAALRASALYAARIHLQVADLFYRRHRGELGQEEFAAALVGDRKTTRLERLVALHDLSLRSRTLLQPLRALVEETRKGGWEERSLALRLLAEQLEAGPGPDPVPVLPSELRPELQVSRERSWQVRLAYAEVQGAFATRASIEVLLEELSQETHPRVIAGIVAALARLTRRDFGARAGAWREWYGSVPTDWVPTPPRRIRWTPPPRPSDLAQVEPRSRVLTVGDRGPFATDSSRVVFAIDVSESMRGGVARVVQQGLERYLASVAKDAELGLVLFHDKVNVLGNARRPETMPERDNAKKQLLRKYSTTAKQGRTDLAEGLRTAFLYPDAEEIFVVTDALPTAGSPLTSPGLVQLVDELNRFRRVRISTLLVRVGQQYFVEDIGTDIAPEPTAEQLAAWREAAEQYAEDPDFTLLSELSTYHAGTCRIAFGTQIYSRNGPPPVDR